MSTTNFEHTFLKKESRPKRPSALYLITVGRPVVLTFRWLLVLLRLPGLRLKVGLLVNSDFKRPFILLLKQNKIRLEINNSK